MSLISILIALAIEIFYKAVDELRRYDWFYRYTDGFRARLAGQAWADGPLGVLLLIGSVVFGVWLVDAMLDGVAAVFSFLFGIAVLVFTIGLRDLQQQVDHFLDAIEREDGEAACLYAEQLLGHEVSGNPAEVTRKVAQGVVVEANNRLFGVLFWFMLLGPMGAVLFRLSCELKKYLLNPDSGLAAAARDLYRIMIWPPARLVVLGFALAGSFVDTVSRWRSLGDLWRDDSETLLIESGLGAISHEPHEEHAANVPDVECVQQLMALVKRTLLVWLAALALLTLTGWVF